MAEQEAPDAGEPARLRRFADEFGWYFENRGLPRMGGRILGWLLVCQPEHQSAEQIAEALSASRGSISMGVNILQRNGAVERLTMPGERRIYYRMRAGFWLREATEKARIAADTRAMAERGLELIGGAGPETRQRLADMREMYAFLEVEYARIEARWRERPGGAGDTPDR